MTFEELVERLTFILNESHPEFKNKTIAFFADVDGDGGYYRLEKLGDIYIDDSGVVNIDINRSNDA